MAFTLAFLLVASRTAPGQDLFPGRSYPLGSTAIDVAVADLNGDGRADAVVALQGNKIQVRLAQAGGELGGLWVVPPAACGAPFGVVTSKGLAITIQP